MMTSLRVLCAALVVLVLAACSSPERAASPSSSSGAPTSASVSASSSDSAATTIEKQCAIKIDGAVEVVETPDGSKLPVAAVVPDDTATTAVLLLAQRGDTLCEWLPFASHLASQGIAAVSVDLCDSPAASCQYDDRQNPSGQIADVVAWTKKATGAERVVVAGASKGGSLALGFGQKAGAAAVIDISGPADWNATPSVEEAAKATTVPLLMIWATGDSAIGPPRLAKAFATSPSTVKKSLVVESGHGIEIVTESDDVPAEATATGAALVTWVKALK